VKIAFAALAAVASAPLAFWTSSHLMQHGLPTPGVLVWKLVQPDPQPGFLGPEIGYFLITDLVVNSACWFLVLCLVGYVVAQLARRNAAARNETNPGK